MTEALYLPKPPTVSIPSRYLDAFSALQGIPVYFMGEVVHRTTHRFRNRILVLADKALYLCNETGDIFRYVPYSSVCRVALSLDETVIELWLSSDEGIARAREGSAASRTPNKRQRCEHANTDGSLSYAPRDFKDPSQLIHLEIDRGGAHITDLLCSLTHLQPTSIPGHKLPVSAETELVTYNPQSGYVACPRALGGCLSSHSSGLIYYNNTTQCFCHHCGGMVRHTDALFCHSCGQALLNVPKAVLPYHILRDVVLEAFDHAENRANASHSHSNARRDEYSAFLRPPSPPGFCLPLVAPPLCTRLSPLPDPTCAFCGKVAKQTSDLETELKRVQNAIVRMETSYTQLVDAKLRARILNQSGGRVCSFRELPAFNHAHTQEIPYRSSKAHGQDSMRSEPYQWLPERKSLFEGASSSDTTSSKMPTIPIPRVPSPRCNNIMSSGPYDYQQPNRPVLSSGPVSSALWDRPLYPISEKQVPDVPPLMENMKEGRVTSWKDIAAMVMEIQSKLE